MVTMNPYLTSQFVIYDNCLLEFLQDASCVHFYFQFSLSLSLFNFVGVLLRLKKYMRYHISFITKGLYRLKSTYTVKV